MFTIPYNSYQPASFGFDYTLHLTVSIARSQLSLVIQQSGASEIYLNGVKIESYGVLSSDLKKVKAHDPAVEAVVNNLQQGENVLRSDMRCSPTFYTQDFLKLRTRHLPSYLCTRIMPLIFIMVMLPR